MSQTLPRHDSAQMGTPQKEKNAQSPGMSLLSPPETKQSDNFNAHEMSYPPVILHPSSAWVALNWDSVSTASKGEKSALISPPISPETRPAHVIVGEDGVQDPQIFSSQESTDIPTDRPLFSQASIDTAIREHKHADVRNPPTQGESLLALEALSMMKFKTNVSALIRKGPSEYVRREIDMWNMYSPSAQKKAREEQAVAQKQRSKAARKDITRNESYVGVRKKVTVPKVARNPPKPRQRAAPKQRSNTFEIYTSAVDLPTIVKPPKVEKRDDVNFSGLEDFCPPTTNLGNNARALKVEWKGAPLDLSNDPDRHFLHEAEVNLAATVRLTCAQYLTSKRRIFIGRVAALESNSEFKKTHAQQSCKIDVNKASRLWGAFDKVGWFDKHHFVQHL